MTASRAGTEGAPEITGSLHRIVLDAVASANRDTVRITLGKTSKHKAEPILRRRETGALAPYTAAEVEEALQQLMALGAIVEAEIGRDASRRPIMSLKAVETAAERTFRPVKAAFSTDPVLQTTAANYRSNYRLQQRRKLLQTSE